MLRQLVKLTQHPVAISANLSLALGEYACSVEIKTQVSCFFCETKASDPLEAINRIDQRLRGQILKWQTDHMIESLVTPSRSLDFYR